MTIRIETVNTASALREWIDFPLRLYTNGRYVPALRQSIERLYKGNTPYNRDGAIHFVLARAASGAVVGRTTMHTSAKFDAKRGQPLQLFGFTEFVEEYAVFAALMDALEACAQANGRGSLFGPVNLLPNQAGGVIHSGYEQRSFVDGAYNHPYYAGFYARYGFAEAFPAHTYLCRDLLHPALDPDALFRFDDARLPAENLQVHTGSRRRLDEQLPLLQKILNESFSTLGYYTPIAMDELAYQVQGLNFLLEEGLLLYLTRDGEPLAFILCIPDISEYIVQIGGNLDWWRQWGLLLARGRYTDEAVLIIKGTHPDAFGQGYMTLLSRELLRNMRDLGYHTLRSTWVEETNGASASQFLKMGGEVLQRVSFYSRALSS